MTEITIRSNNNIAIQKLIDFLQLFDFQIIKKREIQINDEISDKIQTHFASQNVLAKDWLTQTEDEAWDNL